ncbi:alginate lyase family protein [Streptomyces puniciscabiei]|uniref:alginate lyase family protein n=1 Tax=Streptomyces puniciscabiei TaxID=164348 RepID=UPI0037BD053F
MTAQFVRQPVTGDCEITARLVSRSGASGDRVGPLMAKSLSPFDQAAGAIVTGGTGAQLMLRTTVAGKSAFTGNTTVGAPCLLRLKRTGTTFTACASTDDGATCALRRQVGGTEANAECAAKILNAWSSTLTTVTGNADRFLAAGIYGWEFANAAELMCGYDAFDLAAFQDMIVGVFYPLDNSFLTHHNDACITNYWANWDLCNMASVMAIGILTDDAATYDQAVTSFTSGAGNGSIEHAVPYLYTDADGYALGQWQESGRDQGHTIMGMGQMGALCEMAWNQGDDLYSYDNRKFFKAAQYVAKYNTGQDVPCTTYTWGSGQNCAQQSQTVIGSGSRGRVRPVWAMLHFHYNRRLYLDDTYISAMYDLVAPEGGGGDYGSTSGGYDQLGFGTLTYAK